MTAAPSRTAVAAFQASSPVEAPLDSGLSTSNAVFALGKLLEDGMAGLSTAVEAEVYLRQLCRLAVASEILKEDPLPEILNGYRARHLSELRSAEIHDAASAAFRSISRAYSAAVGRDIEESTSA